MAEVVAVSGLLTQWMDRLEFEQYTSFWLDMSDEELRTSVRTSVRMSARTSVSMFVYARPSVRPSVRQ